MARLPRSVVSGFPLHVTQRGNNRQATFYSTGDYERYLESLRAAAERTDCAIHAYVLMTNHVHLLVTPATATSLSGMMQSVGRRYVRYVNGTYTRTGTLWEGRFKSALVDSERYLLTCMRYIELNPVRARIVAKPREYRWSSFGHNALGESDAVITPHPVFETLGKELPARRAAYQELVNASPDIEYEGLIRAGTENGTPIGDDQFRSDIAATLKRRVQKFSYGGARRGTPFLRLSSTLTP